jgi:arylformamidase
MRIFDVSLTISPDMPVWPGDPPVILERVASTDSGDDVNLSRLSMSVHSGTHVDAPFHFLGGNTVTVEQLSLSVLSGRVYVLQIEDRIKLITQEILIQSGIPARTRRLLFKTGNSSNWEKGERRFHTDFTALSPEAASYLVERGIKLIGVDYLSVAPFADGAPTHKILLEAGIIIVEGLDLSQVSPGRYMLYCLPLKLHSSDGAPARVILIRS